MYQWNEMPRQLVPDRLLPFFSMITDVSRKRDYMNLAIQEAEKSDQAYTVGAILVKDNNLVGRGHREISSSKQGEELIDIVHAEDLTIQMAGEQASESILYSTLEPCCYRRHNNNNNSYNPCVELIVSAGISRVIIGMVDLNPKISGKGIIALHKAGIKVEYYNNGIERRLFSLVSRKRFESQK